MGGEGKGIRGEGEGIRGEGEGKEKKRRKRYHEKVPQVRRRLKSPHSSQDCTFAREMINTIHKT